MRPELRQAIIKANPDYFFGIKPIKKSTDKLFPNLNRMPIGIR